MELGEDEAGSGCSDDDDFQCTGSLPTFFKPKLALRNCAVRKHVKKRVLPKNLRLGKNRRGAGDVGDADAHRGDAAGKEMKIRYDAVGEVVLDNAAPCTGLVSEEREQKFRELKKTDSRVLKDHNARSTVRANTDSVVLAKGDENGNNVSSGKLRQFSKLSTPSIEAKNEQANADQRLGSSGASEYSKQQGQSENILGIESKRKKIFSTYDRRWCLQYGGTKRVKTVAQAPENTCIQKLDQTEGKAGLNSLSIEGDEDIETVPGAGVDEDMVICTQSKASHVLVSSQSAGELRRGLLDKGNEAVRGTGWSPYNGGIKRVQTIALVPENHGMQRLEQTEGRAGLESLSIEGEEGIESDSGAEVDEDMVICTQSKAPHLLELGQSAGELCRVSLDMGKDAVENRPNRKHNIYDILIGNNRTDRVPTNVSNPTIDKEVECDDVEELEAPGTAMQALVDEAELEYEDLEFDEEEGESMECPICGINLVDLSSGCREQHVSDCLEKGNVACERLNLINCVGREATSTGATEIVQLSDERSVPIQTVECPVCGMCIEELSSADRDVHTNACLEKGNIPYDRANTGDCVGCEVGSTETGGVSQLVTFQRNVISGTLKCPVCGVCIDELSTVQREEHTNTCLDETKGEGRVEGAEVSRAVGKPDVIPVVTWLTNLNLGKYVDIFVKEEIDWDTLQWLTEEDLNSLGITALGPRRKIVSAIQQVRKYSASAQQTAGVLETRRISDSVVLSSAADTLQGPKTSIADFFIRPPKTRQPVPSRDVSILARSKPPGDVSNPGGSAGNGGQERPISAVVNLRTAGTSDIPKWMCVPGTSFRVDGFKYKTSGCSNWFLTHFHTDHYQGLTRGFRHGKIFCSKITARLVHLRIGIPSDRIEAIPLNESVLIDGVRVTFIDANHCPGSVMILFEPPNGKAVLHTGDFRFCSDMTSNEALRACRISTLILDTTYCDPQYNFPKQDAVIEFVIDAIEAEAFNAKTLFLIGTYTIGKERIFLEVGKALKKYVYVGAAKQRMLDCMDLAEDDRRWLTTKDQESHIHVVPLWSVSSFKRMGSISRHYRGRYNSIVAFSPTGWSFGKDKKRIQGRPGRRFQQGSIIRYEVPYSEHCSFAELKEFVRTIDPENIVPSVVSKGGLTAGAMVASLLCEAS